MIKNILFCPSQEHPPLVPDGRSQWKSFTLLLQNTSLVLKSEGRDLISYLQFNNCTIDKFYITGENNESFFVMEEICKHICILISKVLAIENDALMKNLTIKGCVELKRVKIKRQIEKFIKTVIDVFL
jgi:hypothetical protein